MRLTMILGAVALAMVGTVAQAQSGDTLQTFTRDDFKAALANIGATATDMEGARNIDITFEGSILADGLLLACDDDESESNCYGTSILATFEPDVGTTDAQITLLANMITLTPGTLSVDVSADRKTLYVHAIDIESKEALIGDIAAGFERKILEVLR